MKFFWILALGALLSGCNPKTDSQTPVAVETPKNNRVVLYCSVDQVFSKPIIEKLETQTGLDIRTVYDTESTKTAGLATKIRSERQNPRADVFWSSALLQTLLLGEEGLLQDYSSPQAKDLPAQFVGKNWAGVGVRGRVLVGPLLLGSIPPRFFDFPLWGPKIGAISNPQFGTASDWATAYGARHGAKETLAYFQSLKKSGVRVFPGNGDVARVVAQGQITFGVTDTDDFLAQKKPRLSFAVVQTSDDNVLVPGAVSVIKNAPHEENAKKLFDAIVSRENEAALIQAMPGVFSLRRIKEKSNWKSGGQDFEFLQNAPRDDYSKWPATWRRIREPLARALAP